MSKEEALEMYYGVLGISSFLKCVGVEVRLDFMGRNYGLYRCVFKGGGYTL